MRYLIILLILFLCSLAVFSQTSENVKDTSDFFYYTQIQNALYKITNSNSTIENKRRDAYHHIYSVLKEHPKKEINFSIIASALNLTSLQIDTLINLVDSSLNKSPHKANAEVTRRRLNFTETGKQFPNLILTDTLGNSIYFQDFKGNAVLVDLWSSWCLPCRQQIPELKKIYTKYKSKGFEIIGISMDNDKAAWLGAIIKDKQNWKHYCELKTFSRNKISKQLSVYGIPSNFLLDKNGIILGQDLSPDQISCLLSKEY